MWFSFCAALSSRFYSNKNSGGGYTSRGALTVLYGTGYTSRGTLTVLYGTSYTSRGTLTVLYGTKAVHSKSFQFGNFPHIQYRSGARYKAHVIYTHLHEEANVLVH